MNTHDPQCSEPPVPGAFIPQTPSFTVSDPSVYIHNSVFGHRRTILRQTCHLFRPAVVLTLKKSALRESLMDLGLASSHRILVLRRTVLVWTLRKTSRISDWSHREAWSSGAGAAGTLFHVLRLETHRLSSESHSIGRLCDVQPSASCIQGLRKRLADGLNPAG